MKNMADPFSQKTALLRRVRFWLRDQFCMEPKEAGNIALNGLLRQNPVFVLLLGLCPALASSTSLQTGLCMGLSTAAVLACSELVVSLLSKVIPDKIRTASCLVVIATFTTITDLLLQAFACNLSEALGLYIPLIAVNCIILSRAETFASHNSPGKSFLDGLFTGLGFTGALAILSAVREILGAGTIWGAPVPILCDYPVSLILSPCGGFIMLGCLIALVQFIRRPGTARRKRGSTHESC